MKLYFAYGSNMSEEQMVSRCKTAKLVGHGYLSDYKLVFTRYSEKRKSAVADILVYPGEKVWGIIYSLSEEDISELDNCEGHPNAYRRIEETAMLFHCPHDFIILLKEGPGLDSPIFKKNYLDNINNYEAVNVITYEVVKKSTDKLFPSVEYLELMQDAAFENNFPGHYQEMLYNFGGPGRDEKLADALDFFGNLHIMVNNNSYPSGVKDEKEWGGAELVVTGDNDRRKQLNRDYPDDLVIFTPHWKELSWLIRNIYSNDSVSWQIDYSNKYSFLNQLGIVALEYQKDHPEDSTAMGICDAVLMEAYRQLTN